MLGKLRNWLFERDVNGNFWYTTSSDRWAKATDNLTLAQNHPFLTPGLLFISNLFAQGEFKVIRKSTGKEVPNHWILTLLKNPNYYQTMIDLLESFEFMKIARGQVVLYTRRGSTSAKPDSLYILDPKLITYPNGFVSPAGFRRRDNRIENQTVIYDKQGENLEIKVKDLLFFYDLPAGFTQADKIENKDGDYSNRFVSGSRVDGIKQTLINTLDSHTAKNIILRTNGKEIISGESNGMPLLPNEKKEAETIWGKGYGMMKGVGRTWFAKSAVKWQSAHIAVRDLGLDESTKVDANIVYTALHIPKDIISIEAKKTTYNNFKESMVSFIQNSIQAMMNDFTAGLNKSLIEDGFELIGSYEHLAVMQFIELERNSVLNGKLTSLQTMISLGFDPVVALELAGLDPSIVITPPEPEENENPGETKQTKASLNGKADNYFTLEETSVN